MKHISKSTFGKNKNLHKEAEKISSKVRVLLVDELDALITPK